MIDMRVTLRGGPLSLKLPRTRTTMRITMGGEAEGGARHGEVELLDALVLEEPGQIATAARALRQQLPRLKGARGYLLIDARGVVREAEVELPDALAGEEASRELRGTIEGLRETLSQLTVPLPDEPIGEGARWSVSAPRSRKDGISLLHTAICQLRSRRGDELELAFEVVQSAEPQPITAPAELAGARVELVSYAAEGTGRMRLELDELFPQWVEMALKSELELRAQGGGPSLTIGLDIELQATRPDGE
ncbi:MAG: hypothetical protein H6713_21755 [Myxococcales bacterium]|nr:hypothetical protein [Myxococcales bacterium]